jgi:AcrR family transcriptional regulator
MNERNPFEGREVRSRRGGKVKAPLSRDRIVAEGLKLLTKHGLEGMSLRQVAAALDTGPASLYAYVDDLESLRALVLDKALGKVVTVDAKRDWRAQVKSVLESYARVLLKTPGLAQLALNTIAAGPNSLRIIEALLESLELGGLDSSTGAWAVDLLMLYVTAIGAEHSSERAPVHQGPIAHALKAVSSEQHPRVHAAREELISGDGEERFDWAIETLLTGVLNNPRVRPSPRAATLSRKR